MSDELEEVLADLQEKLDVIDAKLEMLVGQLPNEQFKELQDTVRHIKERNWERRMGDDL